MKESVESSDPLSCFAWLDVLKKGGESPDCFLFIQSLCDAKEFLSINANGIGARAPGIFADFLRTEFFLDLSTGF